MTIGPLTPLADTPNHELHASLELAFGCSFTAQELRQAAALSRYDDLLEAADKLRHLYDLGVIAHAQFADALECVFATMQEREQAAALPPVVLPFKRRALALGGLK